MAAPNVGSLLLQSNITSFTFSNVIRAINTLYGYIGRGLDERNWDVIMKSDNPLNSAESALISMYQSDGYLQRNADFLFNLGYSANQIELTYRQTYSKLGIIYNNNWADGTFYETAGSLTLSNLQSAAGNDFLASLPIPTITVTSGEFGFTISISEAGVVSMSVSGSIGSYATGDTLLTEKAVVSSGTLTVNGGYSHKNSLATTEIYILGTTGLDNIDTTANGARNDHVFGGAGDDIILTGEGNDEVVAGTGADEVSLGAGDDTIVAGTGWDTIAGGPGIDTLYLDSGTDEQEIVVINIANGDDADIIDGFQFGGGLGGFGFDRMDLTVPAGLTRINLNDSLTDRLNNGIGGAGAYPADVRAGTLDRVIHTIAGTDSLGAGTTVNNAVARAQDQLSDGEDFLTDAALGADSAAALLTDDGTNYFLFLVTDLNADQTTDIGDINLIAVFTNPVNIENITMIDFNTAAG